jgi:hypothetical protein
MECKSQSLTASPSLSIHWKILEIWDKVYVYIYSIQKAINLVLLFLKNKFDKKLI